MQTSMASFFSELRTRNELLFYFGLACMVAGVVFLLLTRWSATMLDEVNIWYKPFKFAMSIGIYCWTMGWYCSYLPQFNAKLFSWFTVIALGFEIIYIALQAGRGERSHFNVSTSVYTTLFALMGIAASAVTLYTAYVGVLFLTTSFPGLPDHYVVAIRWAIFIFVIFSFEGAVMGSRLSHTIGGADGAHGIPILNWSLKYGDSRVAHFIGMHALQLLPLLAWYVVKNTTAVHVLAVAYLLLATLTLVQALNGRSFLNISF